MDLNEAEAIKRRIARDYYNTSLSVEEVARKYRRSPNFAYATAQQFEQRGFPREKQYSLIKVEASQLEAAQLLLENGKINFELPSEHFELTEYYESSMNTQNMEE